MEILLSALVGVVALIVLVKLLSLPFKLVWNGLAGAILLWVVNLAGSLVGFTLNISIINSLIAGFFGIPGVVVIILYNLMSK